MEINKLKKLVIAAADTRAKQKANLMYKCVNKLAPDYLCNILTLKISSFYLRNVTQKLSLPKPRTDYLKRSFSSVVRFMEDHGTISPKIYALKNPYTNGSLHRTPTRQICKPVKRKF